METKVREKLGWQKAFDLAKYRLIVFKWSSCYKKENMRRCVIEGRGWCYGNFYL